MNNIDRLTVKYHGEIVGVISLTPGDKRLAFEYDPRWLAEGFSSSPLERPRKAGVLLARPTTLYAAFGCVTTAATVPAAVQSLYSQTQKDIGL